MKRVVQSRTGADGNCLAACVASILELPLKAVPEFGEDWQGDLNDFLATKGLRYRRVPLYKKPSGWSTVEGVSPRGGLHACVALDGELAWDPHPIEDGTGQGLVEPRYYGLLEPLGGRAVDFDPSKIKGLAYPKNPTGPRADTAVKKAYTDLARAWQKSGRKKSFADFVKEVEPVRAKEILTYDANKDGKVTDRADMQQLRKNTERQGGPFFMQETTKSGTERTIPVRELAKGADSKASEVVLLLAAIYAWYKSRKEAETPVTYDLAKYVPKKRALDAPIDRWRMSDILDALGIDIKEYMRRTEPQKKALLKTALEKLSSKGRDTKFTLASANAALRAKGYEERLVRGNGYYYFVDGDAHRWYSSSIATNSIANYDAAKIIRERNLLANDYRN